MTGDQAHWTILDEPTRQDFEAAEEERARGGARSVLGRIARTVVLVILAVALLLYFTAPFNNIFGSAPFRWHRPDSGTRVIPLAPAPTTNPKLPA